MNESEAQEVANLPQREAKLRLLKFMGIDLDFSYDGILRSEIHTELLYNTFTYAVNKGFTWSDVCKSVQLSQNMFKHLKGKSVVEAAQIYQEKAMKCGMDNRDLAVYTDFFFSTFMQHYKLYQYVLTTKRDEKRFTTLQDIEPPIPPEPLSQSKPPALHEYDSRLLQINARKRELKEVPQVTVESRIIIADMVSEVQDQTEAIQRIIQEVLYEVGQPIINDITEIISGTYEDLELKLEETALPRPKQLGAPPRYQTKPAIPMPKLSVNQGLKATQGSAKGERKKSAKAK